MGTCPGCKTSFTSLSSFSNHRARSKARARSNKTDGCVYWAKRSWSKYKHRALRAPSSDSSSDEQVSSSSSRRKKRKSTGGSSRPRKSNSAASRPHDDAADSYESSPLPRVTTLPVTVAETGNTVTVTGSPLSVSKAVARLSRIDSASGGSVPSFTLTGPPPSPVDVEAWRAHAEPVKEALKTMKSTLTNIYESCDWSQYDAGNSKKKSRTTKSAASAVSLFVGRFSELDWGTAVLLPLPASEAFPRSLLDALQQAFTSARDFSAALRALDLAPGTASNVLPVARELFGHAVFMLRSEDAQAGLRLGAFASVLSVATKAASEKRQRQRSVSRNNRSRATRVGESPVVPAVQLLRELSYHTGCLAESDSNTAMALAFAGGSAWCRGGIASNLVMAETFVVREGGDSFLQWSLAQQGKYGRYFPCCVRID